MLYFDSTFDTANHIYVIAAPSSESLASNPELLLGSD